MMNFVGLDLAFANQVASVTITTKEKPTTAARQDVPAYASRANTSCIETISRKINEFLLKNISRTVAGHMALEASLHPIS
ncbi:hypothetical protein TNCV_903121 [Trichonephila clavipes]|nr:hypothetical protein TNCV_903121 [Trichonephila clavipes]